jgi:hypothetical protein
MLPSKSLFSDGETGQEREGNWLSDCPNVAAQFYQTDDMWAWIYLGSRQRRRMDLRPAVSLLNRPIAARNAPGITCARMRA